MASMTDVRNTQRKNARLHALNAMEGRFRPIDSEGVGPEQSTGPQDEVQADDTTEVPPPLRASERLIPPTEILIWLAEQALANIAGPSSQAVVRVRPRSSSGSTPNFLGEIA